jgi:hypothetical protein
VIHRPNGACNTSHIILYLPTQPDMGGLVQAMSSDVSEWVVVADRTGMDRIHRHRDLHLTLVAVELVLAACGLDGATESVDSSRSAFESALFEFVDGQDGGRFVRLSRARRGARSRQLRCLPVDEASRWSFICQR